MNAILSIKPKYAAAILRREKTVEFRKKVFKSSVNRVYIYSSSPIKKIVGYFTIDKIVQDRPKNLWENFNNVGSIDKESFFEYFENSEIGYSICLRNVHEFIEYIDPKLINDSFCAPQSYCYTTDEF